MPYVIEGLDPAPYIALYERSDAELVGRGAMRFAVDAQPGYPCRVTLSDVEQGGSVILTNHVSRSGDTPYRASHAIFVREGASEAARYEDEVPPVFGPRVLSLRGFDEAGMMVDARLSQPGAADADLRALFANPSISEIDVHNAVRGCFSARARRV